MSARPAMDDMAKAREKRAAAKVAREKARGNRVCGKCEFTAPIDCAACPKCGVPWR